MENREDGWWFTFQGDEYGPYSTKAEATEDLRGLKSFEKHKDEPEFITTDLPRRDSGQAEAAEAHRGAA